MARAPPEKQVNQSDRGFVSALARELNVPEEQVEHAYLDEVARLQSSARITTFVAVLAAGRVRSEFRRRQGASP
jgi:hypothetical protein